jgi:fructose-bisphosphate aldolase, class II
MPETSTSTLIHQAAASRQAIAAFNVITLEHAEAIALAAERTGQPVIMQVSENAIRYHGSVKPLASALHAIAENAASPVALHLDHIEDEDLIHQGVQAGFGSIMFDAGRLPYDANVTKTQAVAQDLRSLGIFTEAELGYVGGKATQIVSAHAPGVRTDPDQAYEYVAATGVDALAVAVGSSHAMTQQTAALDLDLIERLRERVPVPLVLHGSSGVPDETLQEAIRCGITKVNIGTALNIAFTAALRESLHTHDTVDPRKHLKAARSRTTDAVEQLLVTIADA